MILVVTICNWCKKNSADCEQGVWRSLSEPKAFVAATLVAEVVNTPFFTAAKAAATKVNIIGAYFLKYNMLAIPRFSSPPFIFSILIPYLTNITITRRINMNCMPQ